MSRETQIYVLRDPRTNAIRYVGKTIRSLKTRLSAHIRSSVNRKTHRDCWIFGLRSDGMVPLIEPIDVAGDDWAQKEVYWIGHFRAIGCNLTNRTDGGEGTVGFVPSDGMKQMMSIRQAARMTPEFRAQLSERVRDSWTEGRRAAWSEIVSSRYTQEERARLSALQNTPEMLARQRAKQVEVWTPERRAARSAQVRAQMTPERIASHKEKLRKTMASPEWKAAHSKSQKDKWTPERRAAHAALTRAQFAAKKAAQSGQPQ